MLGGGLGGMISDDMKNKTKQFSVLVLKSDEKVTDVDFEGDALREELKTEMTRSLGEVFQQWPRAGWMGGSADFVAAFNKAYDSKDQILISAKKIDSEDADVLEEQLNGSIQKLGFHAIKTRGMFIDSFNDDRAWEASGGITRFNQQILQCIYNDAIGGGRTTKLIPIFTSLWKRINRSPNFLNHLINNNNENNNKDKNESTFFFSLLSTLLNTFPPSTTQSAYRNSEEVEKEKEKGDEALTPLLLLVNTFKSVSSYHSSTEAVILSMLFRKLFHSILISLHHNIDKNNENSHIKFIQNLINNNDNNNNNEYVLSREKESTNPLVNEDTLTCLLYYAPKIKHFSFSNISEHDMKRVFEIYDSLGGSGIISGLIGGETQFGLLLIESMLHFALEIMPNEDEEEDNDETVKDDVRKGGFLLLHQDRQKEEESKEERERLQEEKYNENDKEDGKEEEKGEEKVQKMNEMKKKPPELPKSFIKLLTRFGVLDFCLQLSKRIHFGNFELKRSAIRISSLLQNILSSSSSSSSCSSLSSSSSNIYFTEKNNEAFDILNLLKNGIVPISKLETIEIMDSYITEAMTIGYKFAKLLAQPTGITSFEFISFDFCGNLLRYFSESDPSVTAALVSALIAYPQQLSPSSSSSSSSLSSSKQSSHDSNTLVDGNGTSKVKGIALKHLVHRLQSLIATNEQLRVFNHRHLDIVDTTSKPISLHLFFPQTSKSTNQTSSSSITQKQIDEQDEQDTCPETEDCLVEATRTSMVHSLISHVLSVFPVNALPEEYLTHCRSLVGMRIKEQFRSHANKYLEAYGLKIDNDSPSVNLGAVPSARLDGTDVTTTASSSSSKIDDPFSGVSGPDWRLGVVLGFDELSGAHCISYEAATTKQAKDKFDKYLSALNEFDKPLDIDDNIEKNDNVINNRATNEKTMNKTTPTTTRKIQEKKHKQKLSLHRKASKNVVGSIWIRLHLRNVVMLDRIGSPQDAPIHYVEKEQEGEMKEEVEKGEMKVEEVECFDKEEEAKKKSDELKNESKSGEDLDEKMSSLNIKPINDEVRQIVLSGDTTSHSQYLGTFYEVSGKLVHNAPLFRTNPFLRQSGFRATLVEHYFFKSSVSGMWVVTDLVSNFTENLGFLRTPPLGEDNLPCTPVQVFSGAFSGWRDHDSIDVNVTTVPALPLFQWMNISPPSSSSSSSSATTSTTTSSGSPTTTTSSSNLVVETNKISRSNLIPSVTFTTSTPLGLGRFDVYGHNCNADDQLRIQTEEHLKWFEIEILKLSSTRRSNSNSDALKIGLVLSNPNESLQSSPSSSSSSPPSLSSSSPSAQPSSSSSLPSVLLAESCMLCGKEIRANDQIIGSVAVGTESLTVGDRVRVAVKVNGTVCFEIKKKGGKWFTLPVTCDLNLASAPSSAPSSPPSSSTTDATTGGGSPLPPPTPPIQDSLWGFVTLGGDILEAKMIDISGHRVVGEEGRYNIDRNLVLKSGSRTSSQSLGKEGNSHDPQNARVERWLRGSIQLRSRPEFPGDPYRTLHTLSAGESFKFTETKEITYMLSSNPPIPPATTKSSTSSNKKQQENDDDDNSNNKDDADPSLASPKTPGGSRKKKLPKKIRITYYKLADGRGWVHDFDRDFVSPRRPSIRIVSNSLVGKRLRFKNAEKLMLFNSLLPSSSRSDKKSIDLVTVLSDNEDGTLDLVSANGQCFLNEPRTSVDENTRTKKRGAAGTPSPCALQRTFSAVSTDQNPVSNGGFEFTRRENYSDVSEFLKKERAANAQMMNAQSVHSDDSPSSTLASFDGLMNAFPQLVVKFSVLAKNDQRKSITYTNTKQRVEEVDLKTTSNEDFHGVELPNQSTLFQAIHKLHGGVHIDDYFDIACSVTQRSDDVSDIPIVPLINPTAENMTSRNVTLTRKQNDNTASDVNNNDDDGSGKVASVFTDSVKLLIILQSVLRDSILTNPILFPTCTNNKSKEENINNHETNEKMALRNQIGRYRYSEEIRSTTKSLLSSKSIWVNSLLEAKLSTQLKPVAVVTGAIPDWIRTLPRLAPFLFSLKLRERLMAFMAFGISRGIVSLQEERYPVQALEREVASCFQLMTAASLEKAQRLEQVMQRTMEKHATSQLSKNHLKNVSVFPGWKLLREAIATFSDARFLRSGSLDVTFKKETGFGTGVTAGFYSRIAAVLQCRSVGFGLSSFGVSPSSFDEECVKNEASISWSRDSSKTLELLLSAHSISVSGNSAVDHTGHFKHARWHVESIENHSREGDFDESDGTSKIILSQNVWVEKKGQFILSVQDDNSEELKVNELSHNNSNDNNDGIGSDGNDNGHLFNVEYPLEGVLVPKPFLGSFQIKIEQKHILNNTKNSYNSINEKNIFEILYSEKKNDDSEASIVSNGCDYLLQLLSINSGGCGLELWEGSDFERTQRTVKVRIHKVVEEEEESLKNQSKHSLSVFRRVRLFVEGYLPQSWSSREEGKEEGKGELSFSLSPELKGAVFRAMIWVPDEVNALDIDPHGAINAQYGVFPAPLPIGLDPRPVLQHFRFLGRLFGKALVDGYLVPLRLHPTFLALVKGHRVDASVYLPSDTSHMSGDMRASHVAKLFSIFTQVKAIQLLQEEERSIALKKLLSCSFDFTNGLSLRGWLELLSFSEPITRTCMPNHLSSSGSLINVSSTSNTPATLLHHEDVDVVWDSEVTESNLYSYMVMIEDMWLGSGVSRQVKAFTDGLSEMADVNSGSLAFGTTELRNMLCGPDSIDWTLDSLKRILRPKGDFLINISDVESLTDSPSSSSSSSVSTLLDQKTNTKIDTLDWLREALVALDQPQRLKFMELTTGLRLLTPDKAITVRRTSERWPFFHSCTNQLDLPRYNSPKSLKEALEEALANGSAGGFSELTRANGD